MNEKLNRLGDVGGVIADAFQILDREQKMRSMAERDPIPPAYPIIVVLETRWYGSASRSASPRQTASALAILRSA